MSDRRFRAADHVRRSGDFQRAYRRRLSAADRWIVVFGHPNGLGYARLGLSVPQRVGNAVARNRWKRLLREAFRLSRPELPPGFDLIVVPRTDAPPTLDALRRSLVRLGTMASKKMGDS